MEVTEEEIIEIRKKYPISLDEISLYSSFEQILGKSPKDYTELQRKQRWNKMLSLDKNMKKYWSDTTECNGCIHLSQNQSWCNLQGLPCCVNPILSFQHGIIGMACMGVGKEECNQMELEIK